MKQKLADLKKKVALFLPEGKKKLLKITENCKKIKSKKVKKFLLEKYEKVIKTVSDAWKPIVIGVPVFLFCYYLIGSLVAENISTKPVIKIQDEQSVKSHTFGVMQHLLKREVDEHIWTPNLPLIFPAYALDNMPNFQTGIVKAIDDIIQPVKDFALDGDQKKIITKAANLLSYPPNIWLLSKKSAFSIAPSSNSQYRKARKELEKADGFPLVSENLRIILRNMADNLQKMVLENEKQVREFSAKFVDFKSDDMFYLHKGYAFALWQISEGLALDFKQIILSADVSDEWTMLVANLQKAAEFAPVMVQNGKAEALFSPNHLLVQNYYLSAARADAEKISNLLGEYFNATAD